MSRAVFQSNYDNFYQTSILRKECGLKINSNPSNTDTHKVSKSRSTVPNILLFKSIELKFHQIRNFIIHTNEHYFSLKYTLIYSVYWSRFIFFSSLFMSSIAKNSQVSERKLKEQTQHWYYGEEKSIPEKHWNASSPSVKYTATWWLFQCVTMTNKLINKMKRKIRRREEDRRKKAE